MPSSLWDIWKLYNWWWLPPERTEETIEEETQIEKKSIESVEEKEAEVVEEELEEEESEESNPNEIQLDLDPVILDQLRIEAQEKDLTMVELIEYIIESYLESKEEEKTTPHHETWSCDFCEPKMVFTDYFEYSNHFFAEHMQPDVKKLSQVTGIL